MSLILSVKIKLPCYQKSFLSMEKILSKEVLKYEIINGFIVMFNKFILCIKYEVGDIDAFNNAKRYITDRTLFNRAGVYFQNNLLKALAGWNAETLKTSNKESRKSITSAVEKLLRIPQEAGRGKIVFRQISDASSSGTVETGIVTIQVPLPIEQHFKDFELQPLSKEASTLIDLILSRDEKDFNLSFPPISSSQSNSKNPATSIIPAGNKIKTAKKILDKASKTASSKKNQFDDETDEIPWTEVHESVGIAVAAYFPPPAKTEDYLTSQIYKGKITKYAPESYIKANDHLYHVVWEDGDEQDYDEDGFVSARDLYDLLQEGWVTDHESVGTRVAAYFPSTSGTRKKLFTGIVVRYCPPTSTEEGDQLYHVIWEDLDEQDYDESELVSGKALYAENGKPSSVSKSAEKKKSSTSSDSGSITPTTTENKRRKGRTARADAGSEAPPAASRVSQRSARRVSNGSDSGSITDFTPKKSKPEVEISPIRVSERKSKKIIDDDFVSTSYAKKSPSSERKAKSKTKPEPEPEPEAEVLWTEDHKSIGSKIASYFPPQQQPFIGKVTRYGPPSAEGAEDQLYHVEYDDGDSQDCDENDYQMGLLELKNLIPQHTLISTATTSANIQSSSAQHTAETISHSSPVVSGTTSGRKRKRSSVTWSHSSVEVVDLIDESPSSAIKHDSEAIPPVIERSWTVDHPTVGMKVAAFDESQEKMKGKKKIKVSKGFRAKSDDTRPFISGKVVRFSLPSVPGAGDELYQILWDDGDQVDYGENDFLEGLALINKLMPLVDDQNDRQSESGESLISMPVHDVEMALSDPQEMEVPTGSDELHTIPSDAIDMLELQTIPSDANSMLELQTIPSDVNSMLELQTIPSDAKGILDANIAPPGESVLEPTTETIVDAVHEDMDVEVAAAAEEANEMAPEGGEEANADEERAPDEQTPLQEGVESIALIAGEDNASIGILIDNLLVGESEDMGLDNVGELTGAEL